MTHEQKPEIIGQKIAVWFSCGAASAVAARETIRLYGARNSVRVVNNPVMEEGWDNRRFLADVEEWIGQKIETVTHPKWPMASAAAVWEKKRYMAGVRGAPCTALLKKEARQKWEAENPCDWHVLGFHAGESQRHRNFTRTERANVLPILIDAGFTKERCAQIIVDAGIRLPEAYALGLPNANCIGCVKATSPTYWNLIRQVAPDVFHSRCEQSRRIGARLVEVRKERIFLDELSPDVMGGPLKTIQMPECGIFCEERETAEITP